MRVVSRKAPFLCAKSGLIGMWARTDHGSGLLLVQACSKAADRDESR
jgi:hypothetical protein